MQLKLLRDVKNNSTFFSSINVFILLECNNIPLTSVDFVEQYRAFIAISHVLVQGQAWHESLLGRQDAEIKLLETMKRCLATKVKSDKEYASSISSLTQQGKKIERSEDLFGSLITQVHIIEKLLLFIHQCI